MRTDLIHNLKQLVARAPAALVNGANLSDYVSVDSIARPTTVQIGVGALGGGTATVTAVKCADDAAGTNAEDLDLSDSVRQGPGDLAIGTDDEVLMLEFTATKPFVAVEVTAASTTGICYVNVMGVDTGR